MIDPVIDTQFVPGTVITSPWLNGVNDFVNNTGATYANLAVVVTSIANLRLIDKTKYSYSEVTGYYTSGDGGGGTYYYDSADITSVDNNGTIIVAVDGARWKLQSTEPVSIKQFGAKGDWNGVTGTDDTASIQAAINAGLKSLFIPKGIYRTTSTLTILTGLKIYGEGATPYTTVNPTTVNIRGEGSWFYFNHTGRGLIVTNATYLSGAEISDIGTFRDQPTPGVGAFTPNANDYDIYLNNADITIKDIVLLNPTKAIGAFGGNNRIFLERIRGQPLTEGFRVDFAADVTRVNNVHWWPFWSLNDSVKAWTQANLYGFLTGRNDNPMYNNLFCIWHKVGMFFYQGSSGPTSKMKATNIDFDLGAFGILVDPAVIGASGEFVNYTSQCDTTLATTLPIEINGTTNHFDFTNVDLRESNGNLARVEGTNNSVSITNVLFANWNKSAGGFPAFEVVSGGNIGQVHGRLDTSNAYTFAFTLGGTGTFTRTHLGSGQTTEVTTATGDIVVTHGLNVTPGKVFIQPEGIGALALMYIIIGRTNTTFTVRFFTASTTAYASQGVLFSWRAEM